MFRWNMGLTIPFFSTDQMFRWNINLELFREEHRIGNLYRPNVPMEH
jgi:hypothetical protein